MAQEEYRSEDHGKRALEFERYVGEALPALLPVRAIESRERSAGVEVDYALTLEDGQSALIEVKAVTPSTTPRLVGAIDQLKDFGRRYQELRRSSQPPLLVLVISGVLAEKSLRIVEGSGIRLIDGEALRAAAPHIPWPEIVAGRPAKTSGRSPFDSIATRLRAVPPGRASWPQWQSLVTDALQATLCPPLALPYLESPNRDGVNRRDIILPNYASDGFWAHMLLYYSAHYIVVDAKNYVGAVKKREVLQLGNYLSRHGAGLFGVIACRTHLDNGAENTRRELWAFHQKMIVVLNDDDLVQMLAARAVGSDPGDVIRQKIEDFRLGF